MQAILSAIGRTRPVASLQGINDADKIAWFTSKVLHTAMI